MAVAVEQLVDVLELELDPTSRVCVLCGRALDGRRADARHCGASCRREASRLRRLLAGEPVDGYRSFLGYLRSRKHYRDSRLPTLPQSGAGGVRSGPKKATETRTDRAGQFVAAACRELPGHRSRARRVYAAYLRWCREHELESPLSLSAFGRVVEQ